jgi:biotin carboxyl carrier protein
MVLPRATDVVSADGRTGSAGKGTEGSSGEQHVVAPMPGRIVRVLVAHGQQVNAGQPVVVIEAMKMENELVSPRSGRVKAVEVTEGAAVESGKLLVVVE